MARGKEHEDRGRQSAAGKRVGERVLRDKAERYKDGDISRTRAERGDGSSDRSADRRARGR